MHNNYNNDINIHGRGLHPVDPKHDIGPEALAQIAAAPAPVTPQVAKP